MTIRKWNCVLILFAAMAIGGCATQGGTTTVNLDGAGGARGFIGMTTTDGDRKQPAMLYVPRNYDPEKAWPLVVFLHGAGERGDDGWRQTAVGIGPAIQKAPERFPCLVVMPQCPSDSIWVAASTGRLSGQKSAEGHIDDAIRQAVERYNVDPNRISLTGLSLGGYGTFIYGGKNADRFSAFMPICGGGNPEDAQALAKTPMWVFHGADDSVVPVAQSERMVEAIKAAGGNVRFTVYPGTNHNSWDKAYAEKGSIEWLIGQRR